MGAARLHPDQRGCGDCAGRAVARSSGRKRRIRAVPMFAIECRLVAHFCPQRDRLDVRSRRKQTWRSFRGRPLWLRSGVSGEARRGAGEFRLQRVIRPCRPVRGTPLLARQPCARQFFGNCPIRVDSRFCRAHPYTDKSRRCYSHSTPDEGRTELGHPFERRSPRSASNTS
jgi:hypothetical protein